MMEVLTAQYKALEKKWIKSISLFFNDCFNNQYLPSHDMSHHLRTWHFSKQIMNTLHEQEQTIQPTLVEQTFWSVMFHDIGMSQTISPEHGTKSKELFNHFVGKKKLKLKGVDDIMYAIEHHDNKNYPGADHNISTPFHILTLADDLEAYGYMGVYRNIEIYLLRDWAPDALPKPILENLKKRHDHFKRKCQAYPQLFQFQTRRYKLTRNYFQNLEKELKSIGYKSFYFIGHIGVLNYIRELVSNRANIFKVQKDSVDLIHDAYLTQFFNTFFEEVKACR